MKTRTPPWEIACRQLAVEPAIGWVWIVSSHWYAGTKDQQPQANTFSVHTKKLNIFFISIEIETKPILGTFCSVTCCIYYGSILVLSEQYSSSLQDVMMSLSFFLSVKHFPPLEEGNETSKTSRYYTFKVFLDVLFFYFLSSSS